MAAVKLKSFLKTGFSAKHILIGTFFMIFVMIVFVVFRIQDITVSFVYNQIYTSNHATLDFFVQFLDQTISHLDNEFYNLLSDNLNVSGLEIELEEDKIFELKTELNQELRKLYESNEMLDSVFFYSPQGSGQESILYSTKLSSAADGNALMEYAATTCESSLRGEKFSSSNWTLHTIRDIPYLMRIVSVGETFCGGFIRLDMIQNQLNKLCQDSFGDTAVFTMDNQQISEGFFPENLDLLQNQQDITVIEAEQERYIVSYAAADVLGIKLAIAVPQNAVSNQMTSNVTSFIGICAILILMVVLIYICLFLMYRPFLYLAGSMKIVAQGNLDFRISKHSSVHETDEIYQTFNTMLDEMGNLKEAIYEKELEKEKVTKQFLRMQLKSHFFLNCLNIIYSLAQTKRYELIQKLTICLVKYFRYLSTNDEELVDLRDEIDHIQNYMEIQSMRFPGQIIFSCEIEPGLDQYKIPMLMLQTFLENAVKYGIDFSDPRPITLCAVSKKKEEIDGILFTVTDCGEGFSEELLEFYKEKKLYLPKNQEHGIGIINVKNRLHLIYGGVEQIEISNHLPTGAKIEIWIPKRGGK